MVSILQHPKRWIRIQFFLGYPLQNEKYRLGTGIINLANALGMIASPIFEPDNLHKATFNCKQHFFIQNYFLVIFQNSKNLRQSKCIFHKTIVRQLPSES